MEESEGSLRHLLNSNDVGLPIIREVNRIMCDLKFQLLRCLVVDETKSEPTNSSGINNTITINMERLNLAERPVTQ